MKTDSEPFQQILLLISAEAHPSTLGNDLLLGVFGLLIILLSLFLSALFSSAENAFFSLSPSDLVLLNEEESQCYMYEFEFLTKLKNLEPWLLQHTIKQIQTYSK